MINRRDALKFGALAGLSGIAPWAQMQALAQTVPGGGYKALVCLFMFGGNDSNNLIVPTDNTRYGQYQQARPNLALDPGSLLALGGQGAGYGLHPAFTGLQSLFNSGRAAVLANCGPLMVPTSKAQWDNRSVPLPSNLFSHSDQQGSWQSAIADAPARNGWGGRMLERLVAAGATNRGYSAISLAGGNIWEAGDVSLTPYRVSPSGRFGFDFYDPSGSDPLSQAISSQLLEARSDPFQQTWLSMMGRSIQNQRVLTAALDSVTLGTTFPDTDLGRQLQMAAKLIGARSALGLSRQCFFASIGGFDTHGDDQLQRQNELFSEIDGAVSAFQSATSELNVSNAVTLFTASDFGRNLPSNGAGTDHGWGGHQFVVGGAVQGGRIVGRFPELAIDGPDDAGQGVWIPGTSVDQLGGELARWYGADAALTADIFPRLQYFNPSIGLMKTTT